MNKNEGRLFLEDEHFKILADHSPNMIFINMRGRIIYVNDKCEEIMGYTREEYYSGSFDFMTLIAPEYRAHVKNNFMMHLEGREVPPAEYKLLTKSGESINAIHSTKLIDLEGEKAILGIITDITERKKAEKLLGESEQRYREIVDNSLVGIYRTSIKGQILFVNDALAKMMEYESPEAMMRENVMVMYKNPDDRAKLIRRINKEKRVDRFEVNLLTKNGNEKKAILSAVLDGEVLSGMIMDLTDRARLEESLKERLDELEKFYSMAIGRELKMAELKKEIAELKEELKRQGKGLKDDIS
ncbi:MAG: PAS domain S-box protein [Nitrospirae bacterium]|nr:PAS domain S-box protein [Nitrospirota bacterium]